MQPDVIGLMVDTHATHDDEGNELTPATYVEGWHVNTPEPVPEWEQYRCHPEPFYRVYAGGVEPVCYRFPDRETFDALLPEEES